MMLIYLQLLNIRFYRRFDISFSVELLGFGNGAPLYNSLMVSWPLEKVGNCFAAADPDDGLGCLSSRVLRKATKAANPTPDCKHILSTFVLYPKIMNSGLSLMILLQYGPFNARKDFDTAEFRY